MSKYKVGDKIILTVTGMTEMGTGYSFYMLNDNFNFWEQNIDNHAEPLTAYTEPLERKNENKQKQIEKLVDKLHRQATEITRLLAKNKELKEDKAVLNGKIDAYELYGDQHEEEYNQAFNQGAEAAWELARKIVLKNGYSAYDLHEIFNCCGSHQALEDYTYPEAAAKVAEWEKAKEEIKVGDIYRSETGNYVAIRTTDGEKGVAKILFMSNGEVTPDYIKSHCTKTGRHIDIDGFLKQIGGGDDEK